MKKRIFILTLLTISFFSCDEEDVNDNFENESVIIDNNLYKQTGTNTYRISDVQLNGNNLTIKISSSGCDSNSWKAILVDANVILESSPIQRNIKLSLKNDKACLAVFQKEFTFDISILKENFDSLFLNLEGWDSQILYD